MLLLGGSERRATLPAGRWALAASPSGGQGSSMCGAQRLPLGMPDRASTDAVFIFHLLLADVLCLHHDDFLRRGEVELQPGAPSALVYAADRANPRQFDRFAWLNVVSQHVGP